MNRCHGGAGRIYWGGRHRLRSLPLLVKQRSRPARNHEVVETKVLRSGPQLNTSSATIQIQKQHHQVSNHPRYETMLRYSLHMTNMKADVQRRLKERFPIVVATELARIYAIYRKNPEAAEPFEDEFLDHDGPYMPSICITLHKDNPTQSVFKIGQLDDKYLDWHLIPLYVRSGGKGLHTTDRYEEDRLSYILPFIGRRHCLGSCCTYTDDEYDALENLVHLPAPESLWWKDENHHPTKCYVCDKVLFFEEDSSEDDLYFASTEESPPSS
jgi:hypothetical protein